MLNQLTDKPWWGYLEEDIQELVRESFLLLEEVRGWEQEFHDYSFIVFPAAKGYEGFLKKLFLDMKFINEKDFFGKRFRIGRALNPELDRRYRKESTYDKIVGFCGGKKLAEKLWTTWKTCRNSLFHWFPNEKNAVSVEEAAKRLMLIIDAMDSSTKECKINK